VASAHVPATLSDALEALERDEEIVEALGPRLVTAFTMLKRAEWDRYVAAVEDTSTTEITPWELEYYTPFF